MGTLFLIKSLLVTAVVLAFLASVGTIGYRITATALEIRMLGWTLRRVRLSDIEEIHRRGALVHENWSSLKLWNSVTIRRRSGWIRNVVITPDEPDDFAARLEEAVRRRGADTAP